MCRRILQDMMSFEFYAPVLAYALLVFILSTSAYSEFYYSILGQIVDLSSFDDVHSPESGCTSKLCFQAAREASNGVLGGSLFFASFLGANIVVSIIPLILLYRRQFGAALAAFQLSLFATMMTIAYAFVYQIGELKVANKPLYSPDFDVALFISLTMMSSLGFGDIMGSNSVNIYLASQALFGVTIVSTVIGLVVTTLVREHPRIVVKRTGAHDSHLSIRLIK